MRLTPSNISIIKRLLVGRGSRPLRSILAKVEPAELVTLFPLLNAAEVRLLIEALQSLQKTVETLTRLSESQLQEVLQALEDQQVGQILKHASDDEAAYFLNLLEGERADNMLESLDESRRRRIRLYLSYPEDSAGRLMEPHLFSLSADLNVGQALESLRAAAETESIYYVYCTDDVGRLEGVISLRQVAISKPDVPLKQLLSPNLVYVRPTQPAADAAGLVTKYGFIAIPVLDEDRRLLGVITVDEIVDMIQEQATAEVYAQAGLPEDDRVYTPALKSIRNRAPWMFVNLALAVVASLVVSLFEGTMEHLIVLASLKNVVAGISGNIAIQTLTVVTRGLAIGDFQMITQRRAALKEMLVGSTLGLFMGAAAGVLTYFWKGNLLVSVVMFISMFLNSIVTSGFGALVPLALKRFNLDPATGSGVIVTTVSDIFSFFSFLGIASLALRLFGL